MALEGTLKDFSLADIFQLIGLQRKTGVLTLSGKEDTVTVTFLEGKVVASDSLNKRLENRLGHVLVKQRRLTDEQLEKALEIQKETLQRLGFILTHYGIISQEALREALQLQILQVVYRLFRWKDGEYHFSQETTIEYDRDNVVPITAESLLMEGARMIDEWPIIEKRIRSYDMVLRKKVIEQEVVVVDDGDVDDFDFNEEVPEKSKAAPSPEKIKITAEEKGVYDLIDGKRTISEIIEMSRISEFDTCKSMYEMMTRDLIEEVRAKAAQGAHDVVGEAAPTEVPTVLPLPLIILLAALAIGSLATFTRNPINTFRPLRGEASAIQQALKAISISRIEMIGKAVNAYVSANSEVPGRLQDLVPSYLDDYLLYDPWGHAYTFIINESPTRRFLVIGSLPDGQPDTDLFLSYDLPASATTAEEPEQTGGIELVD